MTTFSAPRTRPLAAAATIGLLAGTLVALSGTTANAATTRYEAETAPAVCIGAVETEWTGYSGSGYCNGTNAAGAYNQFTVSAPAGGTATVSVRFANGTTTARPMDVVVNGTTAASASFEGTGAWTAWVTKTFTVPVNAGSNTLRLNPTGASGLANIDYIDVETSGTTTPPSATALYVSPTGTDGAAGTVSAPTTLTSAISRITAGGTIYLRGGTYTYASTITIPAGATARPPPAPSSPRTRARHRSSTSPRRARVRRTAASSCSPTTGGSTASSSSTRATTASTSAAATTSSSAR